MLDAPPKFRISTYPAPETKPDVHKRRVLCIPDDRRIVAAVSDVLAYLSQPFVWISSDDVSELDMRALMAEFMLGYFGELEVMIGAVVPMATDVLPPFMVWCEGQTLLRVDYPELYGRLAVEFRLNEDEFIVPDLRSRMPFGYQAGEDAMGTTGGAPAVTLTVDQIPSHNHAYSPSVGLNVDLESPGAPDIFAAGVNILGSVTENAGGGLAHDNMPPYIILRFAMVAKWRDGC